jgi:PH-interacting protein
MNVDQEVVVMDVEEAGPSTSQQIVDESELYFLVAHALADGPFAHIGAILAQEASQRGLLPARHDVAGKLITSFLETVVSALRLTLIPTSLYNFISTGNAHPLTYEELSRRYDHIPSSALRTGVGQLLNYTNQHGITMLERGLTSLLDVSSHNVLALRPNVPRPIPPLWAQPPISLKAGGQGINPTQIMMLREMGAVDTRQNAVLGPAAFAKKLQHQKTVRGHRWVAYCLMVDKTGDYIITGSDDRLVKVRDNV